VSKIFVEDFLVGAYGAWTTVEAVKATKAAGEAAKRYCDCSKLHSLPCN